MEEQYLVGVGLPFAAIVAFLLVIILEIRSGPMEFNALGFQFKGSSGPVVLWVMCVLALTGAMKLLWLSPAERGDAASQTDLGMMYEKGWGVPQDASEAVKWHRKAAEQGLTVAQYGLASIYHKGHVLPQDHAERAKWLREAAEQGMAEAQHRLGIMYQFSKVFRRTTRRPPSGFARFPPA